VLNALASEAGTLCLMLWLQKQEHCASCFGFRSRDSVLNALASEAGTLCLMLWLQKQEHCA
jgi:hypothetical protein